jgi:uncharacterized CHY-type Zn-finger protein
MVDETFKQLTCPNCGGEIQFDPQTQLNVCIFCGSTFPIEEAKKVEIFSADKITPFQITEKEMKDTFMEWLIQGNYTPIDILNKIYIVDVVGAYFPFYFFSGNFYATWTASSGYYKTEHYTDYEEKYDYDLKRTRRIPVAKTKTVIDWKPSQGQTSGKYYIIIIAFKNPQFNRELKNFCERASLSNIKDFDKRYVLGFSLIPFSISVEESFNASKSLLDNIVQSYIRVPGDTHQDLNFNYSYDRSIIGCYLPFWIITYNYLGKQYQCIIDGQTKTRIYGKQPVDKEIIRKVRAFFLPVIISAIVYFICIFILIIIASNNSTIPTICTTFLFIGFGLIIALLFVGFRKKVNFLSNLHQLRKQHIENFKSQYSTISDKLIEKKILCPNCNNSLTESQFMSHYCPYCHKPW